MPYSVTKNAAIHCLWKLARNVLKKLMGDLREMDNALLGFARHTVAKLNDARVQTLVAGQEIRGIEQMVE